MKQKRKTKVIQQDLLDIARKINSLDPKLFEAEISEDSISILWGMIWICDSCDRVHVGLELDAPVSFVGAIAIALSGYKDRLTFETIPVLVTDAEVFEGDEAIMEYGTSLVRSVACLKCAEEVIQSELTISSDSYNPNSHMNGGEEND